MYSVDARADVAHARVGIEITWAALITIFLLCQNLYIPPEYILTEVVAAKFALVSM